MAEITERLKGAIADRYVIERELGQGGMATVYLAQDVKHDRKVALKVLRPELAAVIGPERFLQEIKVTANLQHSHILPLYDSGAAEGFLFYVMPYVEGETLRSRIQREKQLGIDEAVSLTRAIAAALEHAHKQGVIHRDIKPENILLRDNDPLIADFGIALALSHAGGNRLTETGLSIGTPHYMSPEQAMGDREMDARSDVYSLGAMLFEMLAGDPPYTGSTAQAIVAKVITEKAPPVTMLRDTVPEHVSAAIGKALAKLPADRFHSAASFAEALVTPGYVTPTTTRVSPTVRAAARRSRVGQLGLATGMALVGAAVALAVVAIRRPAPVTTWQYVTLGDSMQLIANSPAFTLSPDGNTLAFANAGTDGLLWVKRRGVLDPIALAGTERATNPVFSPDGEWIAFVANGHLRKIRVTGGAPVTLADTVAGGYGGAAWLDDGTVVYTVPSLNEMRRVSAAGGTATSYLLRDSTLVGGGIGFPVALPQARGVLFQYCASGCVTMAIHVLDLATGRQKLLANDVAQAWYLPTGHLMYARRDGALVAAPFDLDDLEITGEAIPVLESVDARVANGFAPLAWSPSGDLVYVRASGLSADMSVARVTRRGDIAPIDTTWRGTFNSLALSPDGRSVAVGVGSSNGLNIWIKQLDRGPFTRLSFGNQDRRPTWSPDGRSVAFIRDSGTTNAVYVRPVDGSRPDRFLTRIDRQVQEVQWTRDGAWLVLRTDNGTEGLGDLVGVRTRGDTVPVPLVASPFSELHPAVSPDGRWIAYTSNESGANEVYVRPFPETDEGRWQVSNGGGDEPVWSRSGRELFFLSPSGRLMVAQVVPGPSFFVSELRELFDASRFLLDGFHQSYDVSPDGQTFYFLDQQRGLNTTQATHLVWVDNWFVDLHERLRQ